MQFYFLKKSITLKLVVKKQRAYVLIFVLLFNIDNELYDQIINYIESEAEDSTPNRTERDLYPQQNTAKSRGLTLFAQ
jgi:hypothetical protein